MPKQVAEQSDGALVTMCNKGAREEALAAFSALFRRHQHFVLRVALRFVRDRTLAEDLVQEVFCRLLRMFPPTGGGIELTARLTTLLYTMTRNAALSTLRRQPGAIPVAVDSLDELPAPAAEDAADGLADGLAAALTGLSAEHHEVLLLRFVDDLSLAEIAAALEIPLGTVKSRLHLAIRRLRADPGLKDFFAGS